MADNFGIGQPASIPYTSGGGISAGQQLDYYKEGASSPSVVSAADANRLVEVINALLNLKVNISDAGIDSDGKSKPTAKVTISNKNIIIDLAISGAGGGGGNGNISDYDPDMAYSKNDIVRVSPDNDASIQGGGDTIAGCYFAKKDVAAGSEPPNHPLSDGGENDSWGWLSTWPSLRNNCDDDGNPVQTFDDSQEKPA